MCQKPDRDWDRPTLIAIHLLSLSKFVCDLNSDLTFNPNSCFYRDKVSGKRITLAEEHQGLYFVCPPAIDRAHVAVVTTSPSYDRLWLLRRRLGHPSFSTLRLLFPRLFCGQPVDRFVCDACSRAKHHRTTYPLSLSLSRSTTPFSIIHTDIWGPAPVHSTSGARWLDIFVDDMTRFTWAYLLKHKSDLSTIIPQFYTLIKTQFSASICRFRSDNPRDYVNSTLTTFFQTHGIVHKTTCPYAPQQNGVAERKFRHVLETSRSILFHMHVPKFFWGEAVLTAIHLINRLPSRVLDHSTPIDCLQRSFPHVSLHTHLIPRVFGCVCFALNQHLTLDKLDQRAIRCVFLGYSSTQKGYRCYHPPSLRFIVTKDATFDEFLPYYSPPSSAPITHSFSPSDPLQFLIPPTVSTSTHPTPQSSSPPILQSSGNTLTPEPPCLHTPVSTSTTPAPLSSSPLPSSDNTTPSHPPSLQPPQPSSSNSLPSPPSSSPIPPHVPPSPPPNQYGQKWFRRGDWHASQQRAKAAASGLPVAPSPDYSLPPDPHSSSPPLDLNLSADPTSSSLTLPSPPSPQPRPPPSYPLANYVSSHRLSKPFQAFVSSIDSITLPMTVDDALSSPSWRRAMEEELQALAHNHTWDLVPLRQGKHVVGSRWVYVVKEHSNDLLERYKARVVAKGFTQKYGLDYQETFAPVAKMNTVRLLLALAAHRGWILQQYDVKNAFLHGDLTEEIYMALPPGYSSLVPSTLASMVCCLRISLYGLKQSPRAWFAHFTTAMRNRGYE